MQVTSMKTVPAGHFELILIFCVHTTRLILAALHPMYLGTRRFHKQAEGMKCLNSPQGNTIFKGLKIWRKVVTQHFATETIFFFIEVKLK